MISPLKVRKEMHYFVTESFALMYGVCSQITVAPRRWLLSLLALVAVYVTYLNQQRTETEQKRHSEETIALVREQTEHLANQVDAVRYEALDVHLSMLISQLVQSILACRRESTHMGILVGHEYFEQYGPMLWSAYVNSLNRGDNDPWRSARMGLLAGEGAWSSVRGQIGFLVRFVADSSSLSGDQRRDAMMTLTNQLTSGIAALLAVDAVLINDVRLINLAQEFGLLRSVEPQLRDEFVSTGKYTDSAFR